MDAEFWARLPRRLHATTSWSTWPCASARGWPSAGSTRSSTSTAPAGCPPSTAPRPCRGLRRTPWRRSSPWSGAPATRESGDALRHQLMEDTAAPAARRRVPGPPPSTSTTRRPTAAPVAGPGARGRGSPTWPRCRCGSTATSAPPGSTRPWPTSGCTTASYLVVESLYDDYGTTPYAAPRDWPDGERSPGVLTVALIHRPEGLDYREWITRWHGTQSPVSGELQPRTRYVRNEVVRALTDGAPEIDGIVEEGWPSVEHVADPKLFFNAATDEELGANVEPDAGQRVGLPRPRPAAQLDHERVPGGPPGLSRPRRHRPGRSASPTLACWPRAGRARRRHRRKHPWDCPSASSVSPTWGSPRCSTP